MTVSLPSSLRRQGSGDLVPGKLTGFGRARSDAVFRMTARSAIHGRLAFAHIPVRFHSKHRIGPRLAIWKAFASLCASRSQAASSRDAGRRAGQGRTGPYAPWMARKSSRDGFMRVPPGPAPFDGQPVRSNEFLLPRAKDRERWFRLWFDPTGRRSPTRPAHRPGASRVPAPIRYRLRSWSHRRGPTSAQPARLPAAQTASRSASGCRRRPGLP